ncbi:MAG: TldD/PmbA family protein [Desulfurococcaceae archaeon]
MSFVNVDLDMVVKKGLELGADFIDVRYQEYYSEIIVLDNGVVRELSVNNVHGLGIRVIVDGYMVYSSINNLSMKNIEEILERAIKIAKNLGPGGQKRDLEKRATQRARLSSTYVIDAEDVDFEEKIDILRSMYSEVSKIENVISVTIPYGYERDRRVYVSSNGDYIDYTRRMIGISTRIVSLYEGKYESISDSRSKVAGWEFVKSQDWVDYAVENGKLAVDLAKATRIKPGKYDVILDNEMVGLMLHEAFGHASEADAVESGASVLRDKIGEMVASDQVSIIDDGMVENGVLIPFDDEGTPKKKTYIVEEGVLKTFITSLSTSKSLGLEPTGNARVMTYRHPILVRQTNIYMEPRDWGEEEMIKDTKKGLYVTGRGARGGEVNPLAGTFTFTSGPVYVIENGELAHLVKGVMLSGFILETLKRIDAVGRNLVIKTSVFGGCGKAGQTVRVGYGGPYVRVKDFVIGG